jgi:hypothetical protein
MTLPPASKDWPEAARLELIELAYIKAEQRREDKPSVETWRLAEDGIRRQYMERR